MSDIVVTVPKNFRYGDKKGLAAWLDEGDWPGTDWEEEGENYYTYTTHGPKPDIQPGERVYVCCEGRLVGYAPLVSMKFTNKSKFGGRPWGEIELVRAGGAVACTIDAPIIGFRGWRKVWWSREIEKPLDLTPWLPKDDEEDPTLYDIPVQMPSEIIITGPKAPLKRIGTVHTIDAETGEVLETRHNAGMLLPAAKGTCGVCATDHAHDQPHNKESMFYQMQFHATHGRWPGWKDAMAHCTKEVQEHWKQAIIQYHIERNRPIPDDLMDPKPAGR